MSIRGTVTLECDSKGCRAEHVLSAQDLEDALEPSRTGLSVAWTAQGWTMDDEGGLRCPQCNEEGREKGDDDGREYGDPRDEREARR